MRSGSVNLIPIGRLGAVKGSEVEDYLEKVVAYEQVQQTAANTFAGRAGVKISCMLPVPQIRFLESVLCNYMAYYQQIISDTLFGGNVIRFCSSTIDQNNQASNAQFPQLFDNGLGILDYFGHSFVFHIGDLIWRSKHIH